MTNLVLRILTALGFGSLFILCLFLSPYSLAFIFLLINFVGAYEYYRIKATIIKSENEPIGYLAFCNSLVYVFFMLAFFLNDFLIIGSLVSLILPLFLTKKLNIFKYWRGILYITIPCLIANVIVLWSGESDFNPMLIFGVFLLVWSNDIFAYFVGKNFGKRKLAPKLSPNKTVEGFLGGFAGSILVGFLLSFFLQNSIGFHWIALAIIIGFTGPIGDLIESRLKRKAEIKDSGKILPGHGGVLDRMDAFFFSMPFVFLYLRFFV